MCFFVPKILENDLFVRHSLTNSERVCAEEVYFSSPVGSKCQVTSNEANWL
jgi:hypothetical protein